MVDLSLVLPDGTKLAYGSAEDFLPDVGETVEFTRSDPEGKLVPDENGLEYRKWVVLGREWQVRTRAGLDPYRITFLILRLGEKENSTHA